MGTIPETEEYLVYGEEASYAVAPGTVNKQLGIIQRVRERIDNKYARYKGIGAGLEDREINVAGLLDCGVSGTFQVINATFFKYLLGSMSGSGTSGDPYSYTQSNTVNSLTLEKGYDLSTDESPRWLGSIFKRATIRCVLGKVVEVDFEFQGKKPTNPHTFQTITVPSTQTYIFVNGTLEVPTATTLTEIQEITIIVDLVTNLHGGIGDRTGSVKVHGRKYTGSFKRNIVDRTSLEDAMGGADEIRSGTPAEVATLKLNLTDGSRYIYIVLSNLEFNWNSDSELGRATQEDVPFEARGCQVTEVV